jgi:hypothetical protein
MLHMGEEELLRPAHAIFFSGCTATCSFCTAARFAFRPTYGVAVTPAQLAARVLQRQAEGARSLCFIGGDPAPHIPFILATLGELGDRRTIPAVFNSNFYLTDAALDLLAGAIDIYLPDLKFGPAVGPASCGEAIGGMPDYWNVVTGCIRRVHAAGGAADRASPAHARPPGMLYAPGADLAGHTVRRRSEPAHPVPGPCPRARRPGGRPHRGRDHRGPDAGAATGPQLDPLMASPRDAWQLLACCM